MRLIETPDYWKKMAKMRLISISMIALKRAYTGKKLAKIVMIIFADSYYFRAI